MNNIYDKKKSSISVRLDLHPPAWQPIFIWPCDGGLPLQQCLAMLRPPGHRAQVHLFFFFNYDLMFLIMCISFCTSLSKVCMHVRTFHLVVFDYSRLWFFLFCNSSLWKNRQRLLHVTLEQTVILPLTHILRSNTHLSGIAVCVATMTDEWPQDRWF